MEANPTPSPSLSGPAPGQIASKPMASFTKPTRGPVTSPSKGFGFQAQPARKTAAKTKSPLATKAKQLGKGAKNATQKTLARKANKLKKKGKK